MRKVCIERMQDLIGLFRPGLKDLDKIKQCITFLINGLADSNRWVKNQSFTSFAQITFKIWEKVGKENQEKIREDI